MIIYVTKNLINGKKYIGKDSNNNPNYLGSGTLLKKAIKKYGRENFQKEILEECKNQQDLIKQEEYWLKYYDAANNENFYNCKNVSLGIEKGTKYKKEWKDKMRKPKQSINYKKSWNNKRRIETSLRLKNKKQSYIHKIKRALSQEKKIKCTTPNNEELLFESRKICNLYLINVFKKKTFFGAIDNSLKNNRKVEKGIMKNYKFEYYE